jgi:ubiquinone/menaquinone biosynthesis C-methylase UbiE
MQHDFSDIKRWVRIFEDPKRKLYQQPAKVAKYMDIKSGMTVADIGAGTGYFLPHIQSYLKQSGQILGLDISKSMVDYMNKRFKKAGWKNAVAKVVAPDDPKMAKGSVDRILIANTWHHIGNRVAYAKKLKAGLKKGGALYILDFTMDSPFGPGKHHRLTPKQVQTELAKAGFKATILKETIPYHYIVVGR